MPSAEFSAAAFAADVEPWMLVEAIMNRPFVNWDTATVKPIFRPGRIYFAPPV